MGQSEGGINNGGRQSLGDGCSVVDDLGNNREGQHILGVLDIIRCIREELSQLRSIYESVASLIEKRYHHGIRSDVGAGRRGNAHKEDFGVTNSIHECEVAGALGKSEAHGIGGLFSRGDLRAGDVGE